MYDFFDRHFQVWDYSMLQKRLLIRSPQTKSQDYNVDIIFDDVTSIYLPSHLGYIYELKVIENLEEYRKRYAISCEKGQFYVDAIYCSVEETHMPMFDSILDRL